MEGSPGAWGLTDAAWAVRALVWQAMGKPADTIPAADVVPPEMIAFLRARAEAAGRGGHLRAEMQDVVAEAARRANPEWEEHDIQPRPPEDVEEYLKRYWPNPDPFGSSRPDVEGVIAQAMARQGLAAPIGRTRNGRLPVAMGEFLAKHAELHGRPGHILWAFDDIVRAEALHQVRPAGSGVPTARVGDAGGKMSRKKSTSKAPTAGHTADQIEAPNATVVPTSEAGTDDLSAAIDTTVGEPLRAEGGADSAPPPVAGATDATAGEASCGEAAPSVAGDDHADSTGVLAEVQGAGRAEAYVLGDVVPETGAVGSDQPPRPLRRPRRP